MAVENALSLFLTVDRGACDYQSQTDKQLKLGQNAQKKHKQTSEWEGLGSVVFCFSSQFIFSSKIKGDLVAE